MNEVKTLPPLVYGKLSGVLEFFIDEVKITENFNFETNVCDVILQIQWWGESIPSNVRPLRISYFSKRNEPILDSKIKLHSLTYEIKTNIDLFKSYLRSIEVLELAVFDKIENVIIGSAFVRDLVSVIFNDKVLVIPIINYFGNHIGTLKIRLAFHQFDVEDSPKKIVEDVKNNLTEKTEMRRENLNELHQTISNNIRKQLQSLDISDSECGKNIHFNTPVSCCRKRPLSSSKTSLSEKSSSPPWKNQLPEKETYDDSSKVLYFNINPAGKLQKKVVNKISVRKDPPKLNKPISKTGIAKEKIQAAKPVMIEFPKEKTPEKIRKKIKKSSDVKTFQNVSKEVSKINKIYLSPSKSTSQSDLEKIPVKETKKKNPQPTNRVLNYLLGKEMSKQEESLALNEFKNMSPCQNIVSSITDLCNKNVTIKSRLVEEVKSNKPVVKNNLQFNLTDPVEKLYYETFFSKNSEFEVVELLNKPENKFILDRRKPKCPLKESKKSILTVNNVESDKPCCDILNKSEIISNGEKSVCEFVKDCHDEIKPFDCVNPNPNNCLRCKYYKKLGELDKIIESLKVFEDRMKIIEKETVPKMDECRVDCIERDEFLLNSPSSITNLDLNGIEDDMQTISSEIHIERKSLLDDFDNGLETSLEDSDFMEFSDYLARSKQVI